MRLFDEFDRTDASPAAYGEDSFSFLNRAARPYWEKVRTELERWFAEWPLEDAPDVGARFRSSLPSQHWAAWWELYLFTTFSRLGFDVTVHPDVVGTETHPDFAVGRCAESFYLEAATMFSGIVEEGRDGTKEGWVLDLLNEIKSPSFFVGVDFDQVGTERPSRREVTGPVEAWLSGLDPDVVTAEYTATGDLPELAVSFRDWRLALEAWPIKSERRGDPRHRLVGRGPISGGCVNDIEMAQRRLRRKARRYGEPDRPLVLAVLAMSSFMQTDDFEEALFGRWGIQYQTTPPYETRSIRQRNGLWMSEHGPRATAVAAVLTGAGVHPWTVPRAPLQLWLNPWAASRLNVELPFPTATADEQGAVTYEAASALPPEIFGLPEEWPGPDEAFD